MIRTVAVHGYRSLRNLVLPLGQLTLVTGANGTGKSSLYRALNLLAEAAGGNVIGALARQGGFHSVLWAGPEVLTDPMKRGEVAIQGGSKRSRPVSLMLGFTTDELGYVLDLGLPQPSDSMFSLDPEIKREIIFGGPLLRPASTLFRRRSQRVEVRGDAWQETATGLSQRLSVFGELADPHAYPELIALRQQIRSWRFYDSFRTDADAPARQPQVATWTPVMAADGSDVAAALATIVESAYAGPLRDAVATAFPGGAVTFEQTGRRLHCGFTQHGLLRSLSAEELSDGTLRFLLLAAALLSPRPPSLLVLNEPETSLHPDVLPAVGAMIRAAAQRTQVVVVSHSETLTNHLRGSAGDELVHHRLVKDTGETHVDGCGPFDQPPWDWGRR